MEEFFVDNNLYVGAEGDKSGEGSIKREVYALLEALEIPFMRADHAVADTIAECADIERVLGAPICKNLFLCNRQKTEFYLLLMPGDKPFRTADVSKLIGKARLSFASADAMGQYLGLTPGSVSVLGLMNDREKRVTLLIDREVAEGEYIGCHPCLNTSTLKIKTRDIFEKFLARTGHTATILDIPRAEI